MRPDSGDIITGQNFENEHWPDADLSECVFDACLFNDSNLSSVDLRGAKFIKCQLLRCDLGRADAREVVFEDCQTADPQTQRGINFAFARLEEARFARCELTQARFEGAELYAAAFLDCHLLGAKFSRACFHRALSRKLVRACVSFQGSNLELADLASLNLEGCEFSGARLRETDLRGSNLEEAIMCGADLFLAAIDGTRLARADLRGAQTSGLDIRCLASYQGLKVSPDQQFQLLEALGLDVCID